MLGCCQFRLKTIRESDFSYRSATEYLFLPLWRDFLCTLPSGYWHMCENLLAEFFSSLFRDICIKTYWLCPSSFFLWDICTETYRLCPSSFACGTYARKLTGYVLLLLLARTYAWKLIGYVPFLLLTGTYAWKLIGYVPFLLLTGTYT